MRIKKKTSEAAYNNDDDKVVIIVPLITRSDRYDVLARAPKSRPVLAYYNISHGFDIVKLVCRAGI